MNTHVAYRAGLVLGAPVNIVRRRTWLAVVEQEIGSDRFLVRDLRTWGGRDWPAIATDISRVLVDALTYADVPRLVVDLRAGEPALIPFHTLRREGFIPKLVALPEKARRVDLVAEVIERAAAGLVEVEDGTVPEDPLALRAIGLAVHDRPRSTYFRHSNRLSVEQLTRETFRRQEAPR
ncbi:MAG: hypothetical protein ACHQ0J_10490 [Candidatus Dormibacterales bacterium]